ncbi:MAG: acid phosphatase [Pseudolabrys sp.]
MKKPVTLLAALVAALPVAVFEARAQGINSIDTVVVIYAENRSFDNLYGHFPGANGLQNVTPDMALQRDRDGSVLPHLPGIWKGGVTPPVAEEGTADPKLPNKPFAIDDTNGLNRPLSVATRDLWHLFYQNQMQIDGGKNDKFVAFADSGALVMGHYDGSKLPLWPIAKQYTLADNFFMAAFGGSFLNHQWLACACTPKYANAAAKLIAVLEPDNVTLKLKPDGKKSALDAPPDFINEGKVTPDFYAINTLQPPYQPSKNKPAKGGDARYADPKTPTTLPPQHDKTIGDLLTQKGVSWAWYSGAWQAALDGKGGGPVPDFQYHHQPFNYFAAYAPGTDMRAQHLKDGGLSGKEFIAAIDAGVLPQVTFYKPQGNLNEHPGYAEVLSGDQHLADVIAHLEKSQQWPHMLVIVTYDENGGFWDHVAPPKADRWGPGTRIPALIVSPFAKKGFVDHTQYDTTSILRFITKRFGLPVLPGLAARDAALKANDKPPMGDLTAALEF